MEYEEMWSFETANIRIVWSITADYDCDTSFDESGETQANLDSGLWTCFESRMQAIHMKTGLILAEDFLHGSIYENPSEFRDHIGAKGKYGSYFKDMVLSVCADARKTLASMQSIPVRH